MSEPLDPFEEQLGEELRALVGGEHAPARLAAAASQRAGALGRSRRRGRVAAGGALAVLGAAAVWLLAIGVLATDGDAHPEIRTGHRSTTSTKGRTQDHTITTVTTTPAPANLGSTTSGQGALTTTTTVPEPPPEPRCVESTGEPNTMLQAWEGQFDRWYETKPEPDQPASIRVCVDDTTPRVGQTVTVTLVGDDPDAEFVDDHCGWQVWWEVGVDFTAEQRGDPGSCVPLHHGGLDRRPAPPPGGPGHIELMVTHTYMTAGARDIQGSVGSGEHDGTWPAPYGSAASAIVSVTVHG